MDSEALKNGSLVHRFWLNECGTSELIGAFQYDNHAIEFAKRMAEDKSWGAGSFAFCVTNLYSGKQTIYSAKDKKS